MSPVDSSLSAHQSARLLVCLLPQKLLVRSGSLGLLHRLFLLAILFASELLVLSVWLDNSALTARGGLVGVIGHSGAWMVRGMVGFVAIFLTFAYLRSQAVLARISEQAERVPISRRLLAGHLLAMAAFFALSWALYGNRTAFSGNLSAAIWLVAGGSAIALGASAVLPLRLWVRLVRETGSLWACALVAVVSACVAGRYGQSLWTPTAFLTFDLVKALLSFFVPGIVADPATMSLGTAKFSVEIRSGCSGLEGAGLILAFGAMWLWLFRRECRFPQALILIPAGMATIFLLNAARIAGLILVGNAGAQQIALGGFHSQAGWIAFNAVALAFSVTARRVPWLSTMERPIGRNGNRSSENPTAIYLAPFLSILAVGMVTAAASGDFEWLYAARFLAAAGALWLLRDRYTALDWRFGWFGPAIGVLVFAMWIAMDRLLHATSHDAMPAALADSPAALRATWIVSRSLAAIVTVPIAEELAFRGFLLRRLISPNFEALSMRTYTWLGLGISSIAFGILHGEFWFAGVLAGLLYAWALIRRGRIGEAVVAHATSNALLAAYVLVFQKWHFWS